jgi:hypothetical protein
MFATAYHLSLSQKHKHYTFNNSCNPNTCVLITLTITILSAVHYQDLSQSVQIKAQESAYRKLETIMLDVFKVNHRKILGSLWDNSEHIEGSCQAAS